MSMSDRVISLFYGSTAVISDIALNAQPKISQTSPEHVLHLEAFFRKAAILTWYAHSATCVEEVYESNRLLNTLINDEFSLLNIYLTEDRLRDYQNLSKHDDWLHSDPLGKDGIPLMPMSEEKEQYLLEMVEGRGETSDDLERITALIADLEIACRIKSSFTYPSVLNQWNQMILEISNEVGWVPRDAELYLKGSSISLSEDQITLIFDENNKATVNITFFPETIEGNEVIAKLGHHEFAIRTGTPAGAGFWFDMQKQCTIRIH
ncbi:MAG: hypothetical protein ACXACI_03090 [Candidatus Hodarchaeales archaeon]